MRFSGAAVNELRRRAYRSYVSACMSRATDARKGRFSSVDAERKNRTSPENQETDWQELVISKQCAERAGRLHHNHAAVSAAAVVGVSLETHATT